MHLTRQIGSQGLKRLWVGGLLTVALSETCLKIILVEEYWSLMWDMGVSQVISYGVRRAWRAVIREDINESTQRSLPRT